jgi:hypothetical protein
MKLLGFGLALLGIALLYGVLGYNRQTTILEVGGLKATTTEHKTIPFAPLVGGLVLATGLAILVIPRMRRA